MATTPRRGVQCRCRSAPSKVVFFTRPDTILRNDFVNEVSCPPKANHSAIHSTSHATTAEHMPAEVHDREQHISFPGLSLIFPAPGHLKHHGIGLPPPSNTRCAIDPHLLPHRQSFLAKVFMRRSRVCKARQGRRSSCKTSITMQLRASAAEWFCGLPLCRYCALAF